MRKKDKLYTVNKWNRPAFMPEENLFRLGGDQGQFFKHQGGGNYGETPAPINGYNQGVRLPGGYTLNIGSANYSTPTITSPSGDIQKINDGSEIIKNAQGSTSAEKNTSSAIKGAAMQAGAATALNALGSIDTGERNGLFDTLDPVYHLAGGRESGVGNALSDTGVALTKSGNPWLMLAGAGLKIVGGLTNAAFGIKEDKVKKAAADQSIKTNSSFLSNANSFDDIIGPASMTATDVYEGGWFSGGKADRKNQELTENMANAYSWADRSVGNNVYNLSHDQITDFLRNYSAFGGPIETINDSDNMGAIGYGFMSDYLTLKKKQEDTKNKIAGITPMPAMNSFADGGGIHIKHPGRLTNLKKRTGKTEAELWAEGNPEVRKMITFARNARKWKHADGGPLNTLYQEDTPLFAFGGDLQTNISDFSTGLTHVNAGGSHEESPYDGVQMGVDPEGTPNLVEEKETVWNDYVFSNRIIADEETKKKLHLPKKAELTYADISKKLEKEIAERPADPISEAGFKAQMQTLQEQQERQKAEMEAARAREAFEALSPEEQTALMQQKAMEEQAMMNQAAQEQAIAEQQAVQQPTPEEAAMMQQQMMQADGSQAMVGNEPQIAACGGKINKFDTGGPKTSRKNAGTWKTGTLGTNWNAYTRNGLRDYLLMINDEIAKAETEEKKKEIREEAIKTVNNIQKAYSEAYQENLTPSEKSAKVEALQKAFQEAGGNAYFGGIANNINLPKGHNTADTEEKGWVDGFWGPRTSIRNWGSTEYGNADYYNDLIELAREAGLTYAPGEYKYGDNTLYQLGMAPEETAITDVEPENAMDYGDPNLQAATEIAAVTPAASVQQPEEENKPPRYKAEWPRYAGLFGPAVGLGLMAAGVGKPDYSGLDAAVRAANNPAYLADAKYIGDYERYTPLDRQFHTNQLLASSRATDRALINTVSPSKAASLLANGYNTMLSLGNLARQGEEYNDALYHRTKEFNRGTNQYNADAYNRLSQFNADALNRNKQYAAQLGMQAATQKLDADAGWYNSLYGNVSGLFKGLSDLGRENTMFNWIARNGADGVYGNLGTSYTGEMLLDKDKKKRNRSKGGNIKKKKGLTY